MAELGPLGTLSQETETVWLRFERTFEADIDTVWAALTDSEKTSRWFGSWSGDPASGTIEVAMTPEAEVAGQEVHIIECREPELLVLDAPGEAGVWHLTCELSQDGDTTTLNFSQPLGEADRSSSVGRGWHFYLDRLAAVVAGTPVPSNFDDYFDLAEAYDS